MTTTLEQAWAERLRIRAEGRKNFAEAIRLCSIAATFYREADELWDEAVLAAKGNIGMEWRWIAETPEMDCIVDGEVFRGAPEVRQ